MIHGPSLGVEQFQFLCNVIMTGFQQRVGKLVRTGVCSAKPPTKKKVIGMDFTFVVSNISYYFDMMMAASRKDKRRQLCV